MTRQFGELAKAAEQGPGTRIEMLDAAAFLVGEDGRIIAADSLAETCDQCFRLAGVRRLRRPTKRPSGLVSRNRAISSGDNVGFGIPTNRASGDWLGTISLHKDCVFGGRAQVLLTRSMPSINSLVIGRNWHGADGIDVKIDRASVADNRVGMAQRFHRLQRSGEESDAHTLAAAVRMNTCWSEKPASGRIVTGETDEISAIDGDKTCGRLPSRRRRRLHLPSWC